MVELHIYGCNSMKFSQSINYKKKNSITQLLLSVTITLTEPKEIIILFQNTTSNTNIVEFNTVEANAHGMITAIYSEYCDIGMLLQPLLIFKHRPHKHVCPPTISS